MAYGSWRLSNHVSSIPDWHQDWLFRVWLDTALYLGRILGLGALVRNEVLFSVVPR